MPYNCLPVLIGEPPVQKAGGATVHQGAGRVSHPGRGAASDYDLLPYPSMPLGYTQPANLAALSVLFGGTPPDVKRACVLELGCAAGGNIIPLAARFPRASFLGIDLSQRHVDDGQRRIKTLGLGNVSLQQADLTTFTPPATQFDYVICHGVFSWVPKQAQEAIFRLCRDVLAPGGMAAISYNVLPGWNLRMAVRDICLHYGGNQGTPQQRVARARAALDRIPDASDAAEPYGMLMRTEAQRLKGVPSSYILGEFLAPFNTPWHVRDFISKAADHELDFLCEADLFAAIPQTLDPALRNLLTAFGNVDRAAAEQHIDFMTGRLFRRSVLVKRDPGALPQRTPDPGRLWSLHVSSPIRLDPAQSTEQSAVFVDGRARPVTISDPVIRKAISEVALACPGTVPVHELARQSAEPETVGRIHNALMTMVLAGRATLSVLPLKIGCAERDRPVAWPVARAEAAAGQPWITSLCHIGIPAEPVLRFILPLLDGTNDHEALVLQLSDALDRRQVRVPELPDDKPNPPRARLRAIAEQYLNHTMAYLERQAVLEPAHADTAGQI